MPHMQIRLGDRPVGDGAPCLVVAAIGSNHDGDLGRAEALIDAAAAARADAVCFESFTAATLLARRWPAPDGGWVPAPGYAMLERLALRPEWHARLRERAQAQGLLFLATPFDETRASLLAALGVPALPVAAGDLTHAPLLERLGTFGRPVVLATSMAPAAEVAAALAALDRGAGAPARRPPIVLLAGAVVTAGVVHASLRHMTALRERYGCLTGWSDRVMGTTLALGAAAIGACIVEKGLTDDRSRPGPDHASALQPGEFATLVGGVRELEGALAVPVSAGCAGAGVDELRRSVHAARSLAAGTPLTAADVKIVRPGGGLPPSALPALIGRRLVRPLAEDEPIGPEDCA
ncbi:MAG: N-acetylneuraminate synthase family protein [Candidatus Binatia bacterium]